MFSARFFSLILCGALRHSGSGILLCFTDGYFAATGLYNADRKRKQKTFFALFVVSQLSGSYKNPFSPFSSDANMPIIRTLSKVAKQALLSAPACGCQPLTVAVRNISFSPRQVTSDASFHSASFSETDHPRVLITGLFYSSRTGTFF